MSWFEWFTLVWVLPGLIAGYLTILWCRYKENQVPEQWDTDDWKTFWLLMIIWPISLAFLFLQVVVPILIKERHWRSKN